MTKAKIITSVAASAALAVLPAAATFAAENITSSDTVSVTIDSACSLTATGTQSYSTTLTNGGSKDDLGSTSINIKCNDPGGWSVKAVGGNTSTTADAGNTDMAPSKATSTPIKSVGTFATGASDWGMKLTAGTGDYAPTIVAAYSDFTAVPGSETAVVTNADGKPTTDQTTGSTFTTMYKVAVSATQQADTYIGKVNFKLYHPAS